MKLKYYLSLLTIFFLVSFISSQNPQPDKRLLDYFGQEKLDILMKNSPDIIYYYNFYLDNSWIIEELPQEKLNSKSILGVISLATNSSGNIDLQNINILKLNIKREYYSKTYYRIANTNKVIIFLSEEEFMKNYNKHRKSLGLIKE